MIGGTVQRRGQVNVLLLFFLLLRANGISGRGVFIVSGVWADAIGAALCTVGELIRRCSSFVSEALVRRGWGGGGGTYWAFWCWFVYGSKSIAMGYVVCTIVLGT